MANEKIHSRAVPDKTDSDDRQQALEYLAQAWNAAEEEGIEGGALAHASLFAAIATLVSAHGEEIVATLVGELPAKIRAGDYTIDRVIQ